MHSRPFARRLRGAVLLLALSPGCQVVRSCRPLSVQTVDAETHQPISGAEVRVSYPLTPAYRAPAEASGTTGTDGMAGLRVASVDEGLALEATAPGYLLEQKSVAVDAVPAAEPFRLFGPAAAGPPATPLVVELYAEPGPTVELVLPPGYRGRVRVEVRPRDDLPCPPGQRRFRYEVAPSGVVQAVGPALLRRTPNIVAGYADGAPLSTQPKDGEVGFLWVKSEGDADYFVVGTTIEREALRRSDPKDGPSPSSDGGQTAGRGHKGRRGGQPAADPNADGQSP